MEFKLLFFCIEPPCLFITSLQQKFDDGWKEIFNNMQQEKASMESKLNSLTDKMLSLTQHVKIIVQRVTSGRILFNSLFFSLDFLYPGLAGHMYFGHPGTHCFSGSFISSRLSTDCW